MVDPLDFDRDDDVTVGVQGGDVEAAVESVDESPELRRSVEQEIQGTVDTNHPDAKPEGLTLEAEERMQARELEIERTRFRIDRHETSDREARTRRRAARGSHERRQAFQRRAASVDPACDPDLADPRARLTEAELRAVNQEAARLAERLDGWTRAAVSRRLAERVARGAAVSEVSLDVFEEFLRMAGQVIPIASVGQVDRGIVSIAGTVETLWEPSHRSIAQLGLIEDETDRIKFTSWVRSDPTIVEEGRAVRLYDVATNWYEGRCSVVVTYDSRIEVTERGRWWD